MTETLAEQGRPAVMSYCGYGNEQHSQGYYAIAVIEPVSLHHLLCAELIACSLHLGDAIDEAIIMAADSENFRFVKAGIWQPPIRHIETVPTMGQLLPVAIQLRDSTKELGKLIASRKDVSAKVAEIDTLWAQVKEMVHND